MEEIAAQAGLTKRTVYNNYAEKDALFRQIVGGGDRLRGGVRSRPARGVHRRDHGREPAGQPRRPGRRLALGIVRPEVIALRRLLIGEAREFPALAAEYFDRAPGQVLEALASGFAHLGKIGLLRVRNARRAAAQFAYLVAGEPLDRSVLMGRSRPGSKSSKRGEGVEPSWPATVGPADAGEREKAPTVTLIRGEFDAAIFWTSSVESRSRAFTQPGAEDEMPTRFGSSITST